MCVPGKPSPLFVKGRGQLQPAGHTLTVSDDVAAQGVVGEVEVGGAEGVRGGEEGGEVDLLFCGGVGEARREGGR